MSEQEWLTLRDAADRAGVSRHAVARAVRSGALPAQAAQGNGGRLFLVAWREVERWLKSRAQPLDLSPHSPLERAAAQPAQADRPLERSGAEPDQSAAAQRAELAQPLSGELLQQALDLLAEEQEERRRAVERAHQAELLAQRQIIALQTELMAHRRALEENAASIAEREARARQAEASASEARQRTEELSAEAAQAAAERRLRERLEAELEVVRERAVESEARAAQERRRWERVPSWVRRLLGAG